MEADDARARQENEDHWVRPRSLHKDAAQLLLMLARAADAKQILEIGTSASTSPGP